MKRRREGDELSGRRRITIIFMHSHRFVSTGLKFCKLISDVCTTRTENISGKFQKKNVNNKTLEHRTEEAAKALFWKSALIMTSRYPRERTEVDRKKRRAADTNHCRFHVSLVYNRLPIRNNVSKSFRIFRIVCKSNKEAISEQYNQCYLAAPPLAPLRQTASRCPIFWHLQHVAAAAAAAAAATTAVAAALAGLRQPT
jgi:hypothetical protein